MHLSLTKYSRILGLNYYYYYLRITALIPTHAAVAQISQKEGGKEESERVEDKLRCLCFRTDYYVIILLIDDFPCLQKPIGLCGALTFFPAIIRHLASNCRERIFFSVSSCDLTNTIVIENVKTPCHHRYDLLRCHYLLPNAHRSLYLRTIRSLSLRTVNRGNLQQNKTMRQRHASFVLFLFGQS